MILDEAKKRLRSAGYDQVSEREDWRLEAGKKYFFTRNHSTIVAFAIGKKYVPTLAFYLVRKLMKMKFEFYISGLIECNFDSII